MGTEPKQSREEIPAPSRDIRLKWWFIIYLAGSVPLFIEVFCNVFNGLMLAAPLFFPIFLGLFLWWPLASILPTSLDAAILPLCALAGYGAYAWHLYLTLKVKTQRSFRILLLILFLVVFITASIAAGPVIRQ
jgi:hypothetical protein